MTGETKQPTSATADAVSPDPQHHRRRDGTGIFVTLDDERLDLRTDAWGSPAILLETPYGDGKLIITINWSTDPWGVTAQHMNDAEDDEFALLKCKPLGDPDSETTTRYRPADDRYDFEIEVTQMP